MYPIIASPFAGLLAASNGETSDVAVALLSAAAGAILGSLLTLGGEFAFRRSRLRDIRGLVRDEILAIKAEAERRLSVGGSSTDTSIHPPLSTVCWQLFVSSGASAHLAGARTILIAEFYREVERSNYLSGQIPMLVGVAASAQGAVGASFLDQAEQFAVEPLQRIIALADGASIASRVAS